MKFGAKSGLGKAAAALCAGLCCTVMASAQAQSDPQNNQPRKEGRRDFRDLRDARESRDSRWGDARDPRSFEARAEEQRRLMEENNSNAEASRRMGRMTADERRDLRRQINEAGQQVYSLPPKR
ncbi:hypothetical protein GTP41_12945 [Pseudoduganella sp. DS3]|uniref:DUF4148 domain-containing protein n=1 Tax=Pseudoduganella guangdongensis TaxID=2692179 RepID=A0A6N9HI30_9BURK|nr:hypothetical protein [Pseudoduganella guangdongensis]MYN03009.1 hypothetical protein [Pseudoduganella guangdongensis]